MNSLHKYENFENVLSEVSLRLVNIPFESFDSAIKEVLKILIEFFDVDRCHIGKLDKENSKLAVTHFYFRNEVKVPEVKYVDKQFLSYIYDSIVNERLIAVENFDEIPSALLKDRQYFIKNNITSFLLIPLKLNDNTRVGLSLSTVGRPHLWPERTIQHLSIIFNVLANVIQHHNTFKQMLREKNWSEAVLESMPQLAYVFDSNGIMKRWNKNIEKVLGYSSEELKNMHIGDFIAEFDREKIENISQKVYEDGGEQATEEALITKSGKILHYYGSGKRAEIDGELYLIGMTIDISEKIEAQQKIEKQLEEINKLKEQLQKENYILRQEIRSSHEYKDIIGESDSLKYMLYRIEQVASQDTTVLLKGETGTGKGLFAYAIHQQSKRRDKPFITVNCASLAANLIESEFFGHEKGAFTGAIQRQIGRFELADGGTIFLDEIGEIPIKLQAKLLRVLQDGEFERIGNSKTIKVDVRIIAATNRDLEEDIQNMRFRKDLYYRLNVFPISITALRDRKSDIPLLVEHFIRMFNKKMGKNITNVPRKTMLNLQNYSWPGNIRELENVIERAFILSPGTTLIAEPLKEPGMNMEEEFQSLAEFERSYIINILEKTLWRIDGTEGAARILDMHPETLRSRMRKLKIHRPKRS
jgi:PAS domain S-box-containing protein